MPPRFPRQTDLKSCGSCFRKNDKFSQALQPREATSELFVHVGFYIANDGSKLDARRDESLHATPTKPRCSREGGCRSNSLPLLGSQESALKPRRMRI